MKQLLSGNQAIALGLKKANVNFFASYPITPASEIQIETDRLKIKTLYAEDEIAAINMAIGASLAGTKSATATSGPGFSLKQESIGYAFKINCPLVIIDSQRVGPSTGMPTYGAQGDIIQARHGSHGDYTNIVLYPNSIEECYRYAIEAVNAAEESKSPVIFLTDGFLSRMYENIDLDKVKINVKESIIPPLGKGKRKFTGLTSKDDLPATANPQAYREWYISRKKEIIDAAKKYKFYEYHKNKNSDTLLIAYGITSRVIFELKEEYDIFRPITLFPVIDELKKIASKYKKIVVIEMNDGQYKEVLEAFLKRDLYSINQLGGKISLEEIKHELSRINK